MEKAKIEGELTFDINSGKFWVTNPDDTSPLASLEFGDSFEVKNDDGEWIQSGLEITNDSDGNLLFKLKNTTYSGILDGVEVRV